MWEMVKSQSDIMRDGTTPEETMEALQKIFERKTRDMDIVKYAQSMDPTFLVSYQKDIAGFRPTAPPYWPKPVVLALMDTLRNHIHQLLDGASLDVSAAFMPMSIQGEGDLPAEYKTLEKAHKKLISADTDPKVKQKMLKDTNKPSNKALYKQWRETSARFRYKGTEDKKTQWTPSEVKVAVDEIGQILAEQRMSTVSTEVPKKTIHMLSVFMEIEETTRSKYNYTMSENDRAFALYMLDAVVRYMRKTTEGSTGEVTPTAGDAENRQLLKILEGYRDEGGNDDQQLRNRMKFEAMIDGMVIAAKEQIVAAPDDEKDKTTEDLRNEIMQLQKIKGLPYWAIERITAATGEVR